MELNEIHTEHEHATTSLKVLLLVFAIVLVGALAYLVWASNTAPDTTDNSAVVTKKTESTASVDSLKPDISDYTILTASQKAELTAIARDDTWTRRSGSDKEPFSILLPPSWIYTSLLGDGSYSISGPQLTGYAQAVIDVRTMSVAATIETIINTYDGTENVIIPASDTTINGAAVKVVASVVEAKTGEDISTTKHYVFESKGKTYSISTTDYAYVSKKSPSLDFAAAKEYRKLQLAINTFQLN